MTRTCAPSTRTQLRTWNIEEGFGVMVSLQLKADLEMRKNGTHAREKHEVNMKGK